MNNKEVMKYLDEMQEKNKEIINTLKFDAEKLNKEIFQENKNNKVNTEEIDKENTKTTTEILKTFDNIVSPPKKNKVPTKERKDQLKIKLSSFDLGLNKLQDNISSDLKNQTNIFEEKKKNKIERLKSHRGSKYFQINKIII